MLQRLYRGYKAREWMDARGINFDLRMTNSLEIATGEVRKIIKPRGWIERVTEAEIHQRVMFDVHQRRINYRNTIASELQKAYLHTSSLIRENIRYWEQKVCPFFHICPCISNCSLLHLPFHLFVCIH